MEKVFEIYIKTTPEQLWKAVTDSKMRAKYSFGVGTDSDQTPIYRAGCSSLMTSYARAPTASSTAVG
jgi:hypothetical protein